MRKVTFFVANGAHYETFQVTIINILNVYPSKISNCKPINSSVHVILRGIHTARRFRKDYMFVSCILYAILISVIGDLGL